MLLVVNIGNSNIRLGLAEGADILQSWTINTKPYKTTHELFLFIQNSYTQLGVDYKKIKEIVIGSVVPNQTRVVAKALHRIHGIQPNIVDRNTVSPVVHGSNQLGTDLYANAVAAHELYQGKKIVIDFGTALTLTGVDETGKFMGVIIAPGVITSLKALIGDTAQLPDIDLSKPTFILGKETETCMQSGMVYGYLSMVEGLINRINKEYNEECFVISTGGLGHIYQPLTPHINLDDKFHTIKGLCFLHQWSKKK